jgi:transposase
MAKNLHSLGRPASSAAPEEARRATGGAALDASRRSAGSPDPEVPAKSGRRSFSAAYKLRILAAAEHSQPGEIGALLRREGLYSSHLTCWRKQRDAGALSGLAPRKRGRNPDPATELNRQILALKHEYAKLQDKLRKAETIIEVQKKLSTLWGIPLEPKDKNSTS